MAPLRASVYVAPPIPWVKPDGKQGGFWSPISCTLIHGEKEAVLVDTPITTAQTTALADWIEATIAGKRLTHIYITHGHGDHFYGIPTLLKRFPGAAAVATAGTVAHMKDQIEPKFFRRAYGAQFPGQIDQPFRLAAALPASNEFELEGHVLRAVEVGQADTHDSTVLWVPALKLAVCGDVVYGGCHQMLGETDTRAKRLAWIASVEKVEALGPQLVVPGHMLAGEVPGTFHLAATKEYIASFQAFLDDGVKNPRELSKAMLERYPERYNPGALAVGAMAAFKSGSKL